MKHHPCPCPSPRKCWKPQLWLLGIILHSVQLFFFFHIYYFFLYLFKLFNCTCFSGEEFSDCGHNDVPYDERKVLNWKDNCHGHKWVKHNVLIINQQLSPNLNQAFEKMLGVGKSKTVKMHCYKPETSWVLLSINVIWKKGSGYWITSRSGWHKSSLWS